MDETELYSGTVEPSPDVLVQTLSEEVIFLHLPSEQYYGLDATGAAIYQRLVESDSVAEAHRQLLEEFDVPAARLQADVIRLIGNLLEQGIITFRAA
jgi:hypothetical protein